MDFILRKFAFIYLKFSEYLVNFIVWVYAIFHKRKDDNKDIKSIGAYWYYPPDLTGSNLRLGGWTKFFEDDGIKYDNFSLNKLSEHTKNIENGTWTQKYMYFAKNLWRRLPQILKTHNYDTVWIDRAIIPFYPRKSTFLEKQIKKVVKKMVIDVTDGGDYQDNPEFYGKLYSCADELTVGYKFLTEYFGEKFKLSQVFWTIPTDDYIVKNNYKIEDKIVLGWMGSPANFQHVLGILPALQEIAKEHNIVLRYICRENFDDKLEGINTEHHYFGDDYYKIISSFDIGISPFLVSNLRTKGKIAMKHQEFLLMGIPQICSPVAISEFVENGKHAIIVDDKSEWKENIIKLIENNELRNILGDNSKLLFNENYQFESQYLKLKKTLINK